MRVVEIAKKERRRAGVVILLVGLLFTVSMASQVHQKYSEAETIGVDVQSFEELSERFSELAQDKGGEYAFEVLKRAFLPPQTDLHLLGHVVGEKLYTQKGVEGIQTCTPDFRNACSHSIVIGALSEFGEGALPEIRAACEAAPGGLGAYTMCFHGLGHGVFAGYGYELEDTIDFCRQTGTAEHQQREYIECFGGAIMELMGGGGHDPELWLASRAKYLDDPLAPCMSDIVPDELKEICLMYATPNIWDAAGVRLGSPDPDTYTQAFSHCDTIPTEDERLRRACFGGFGKEFIPLAGARDIRDISSYSNDAFSRAIEWCTYAQVEDGIGWCVTEGLNSVFWGGENDPQASFRYCALVGDTAGEQYQERCYHDLASNIGFYILDQKERESLCAQLPPEDRNGCTGF